MLGLASTVSSGSVPESKYSLTFDGSDDFINLGPSNNFISTSQAEVSLSVWIKSSTDEDSTYVFANQKGTGNSNFSLRFHSDGNRIRLFTWNGSALDATTSDSDITDGNWHHVVVTGKTSEQKIYIDGSLEKTATNAFSMEPSADTCSIGNFNNTANFQGQINDLAIWNVVLDADAVTAIYNGGKPTNLTFDSGNYDNSSALVAYYKMGNGLFDDKVNGVVHDQHAPGYGAEILNQPILTGTNWSNVNGTVSDGVGTVTIPADGTYSHFRHSSISYTEGAVYRVVVTVKGTVGKDIRVRSEVGSDNGGLTASTGRITLTGSLQTETFYFTSNDQDDDFRIERHDSDEAYSFEIHGASLKKLNGRPGLTSDANGSGFNFSSDTP
jgi:hypothetical protein